MPWVLEKDTGACPASKPFAVKNQAGHGKPGTTVVPGGCHSSRTDALRHMRALYANVPDSRAVVKIERELMVEGRRTRTVVAGLSRQVK